MAFFDFLHHFWDATWRWAVGLPTLGKAFAAVAGGAVLLVAFLRALGDIAMILRASWHVTESTWKRVTRRIWWYCYGLKYGVALRVFDTTQQRATVTVKIHKKTDWKAGFQWNGAMLKIWQRVDGVKQPRAILYRLLFGEWHFRYPIVFYW